MGAAGAAKHEPVTLAAARCRGYTAAMPASKEQLLQRLRALDIAATTHEHPPVFTVEQAREHTAHLPGGHCKSLFLKDKKGGLWLVVCLDERRLEMNALARALGAPRFSFGKPELLAEVLGVTPGSVTPFALINDAGRRVRPVLDAGMLTLPLLNYHPLINTATTALTPAGLRRFIAACGHEPAVLDMEPLCAA